MTSRTHHSSSSTLHQLERKSPKRSEIVEELTPAEELLSLGRSHFGTVLADPPWRFTNRTGKMAPEHKRLARYGTMELDEIKQLPVSNVAKSAAHLYLWVPNALIHEGLDVM